MLDFLYSDFLKIVYIFGNRVADVMIPDGAKAFDIKGDRFKPGISMSNPEVGLASLSIAAFVLRLVCTNGLVAKSDVSASYRHVSTKILSEFPQVLDKVSYESLLVG